MRHRFHALSPYFAIFPESFAEEWIQKLTEPGDVVLDPFCGRGTTPFQSILMGRNAVGTDVNPVAYVISHAKCNAPALSSIKRRLSILESEYVKEAGSWTSLAQELPEFFHVAYNPKTLGQILFVRSKLNWAKSKVDCMVSAILLGCLHGETIKSPSYLSNQMPRTISTKPAYSVRYWKKHGLTAPDRDLFELTRRLAEFRYKSEAPTLTASIFNADMRDLHSLPLSGELSCVVTSPPYLDVTSFEEDQWLRLWFLGGPPHPTRGRISRDDRIETRDGYWQLMGDMWRSLGQVLAPDSDVVLRIGTRRLTPTQLAEGLEATAVFSGRNTSLQSYTISDMAKRQTRSFRPGSEGVLREVDVHLVMA